MDMIKKISQIFFLLLLTAILSSCQEKCYESDEFDSYQETVSSNPVNDGVFGEFNNIDGGQTSGWRDTSLRTDGGKIVIKISGQWTEWYGEGLVSADIEALPLCNICAKSPSSPNCICINGKLPEDMGYGKKCQRASEDNGYDYTVEDDPNRCTCTRNPIYGYTTVYDENNYDSDRNNDNILDSFHNTIYYINLNYFNKDETVKTADQQDVCRHEAGFGLYLGLFGTNGTANPSRIYHLYTNEKACSVNLNEDGECIDEYGVNKSSYIFRTLDDLIFMKNDNDGNDGTDTNYDNNVYHTANELVKLKIIDRYFDDNAGRYNLNFIDGIGYDSSAASSNDNKGTFEYIVSMFEDILLGPRNADKTREGGILKYMYNSIVKDSAFISIVRLSLILYITLYGIAILAGATEVNRKEISNRLIKIALIIFFISPTSWYWYDKFVVRFFYDSLNYMVGMLLSFSEEHLGISNTEIATIQLGRDTTNTQSLRFAYIDNTVKMLMSEATTAKILGLFSITVFSPFYIAVIYFLIGYFIFVMIQAVLLYVLNLMKIVFCLILGPIFILLSLFGETNQMFKNWVAFLAGRSMEVLIAFFILYNFVMIINDGFYHMLNYRACAEKFNFIFGIPIILFKSDISRPLVDWMIHFSSIAILIAITKFIFDKIPYFTGLLVTVSGVSDNAGALKDYAGRGESGMALASAAIFGAGAGGNRQRGLVDLVGKAASKSALAISYGALGAGKAGAVMGRVSGVTGAIASVTNNIPINNPRAMARNSRIDAQIKKQSKIADSKGYKGEMKERFIRQETTKALQNMMQSINPDNPKLKSRFNTGHSSRMMGLDLDSVQKRLDQKLVEEPLRNFIKEEAKRIKSSEDVSKIPIGKEFKDLLASRAKEWAGKNLTDVSAKTVNEYLSSKPGRKSSLSQNNLKRLLSQQSTIKASEAAKLFHGNERMQAKYRQHLVERKAKQDASRANREEVRAKRHNWVGGAPFRMTMNALSKVKRLPTSLFEKGRIGLALSNFERNMQNEKIKDGNIFVKKVGNFLNITNRNHRLNQLADGVTDGAKQARYSNIVRRGGNLAANAARASGNFAINRLYRGLFKSKSSSAPKPANFKSVDPNSGYLDTTLGSRVQNARQAMLDPLRHSLQTRHEDLDRYKSGKAQKDKSKSEIKAEQDSKKANKRQHESMQRTLREIATSGVKGEINSVWNQANLSEVRQNLTKKAVGDLFKIKEDGSVSFNYSEDNKGETETLMEKIARVEYMRKANIVTSEKSFSRAQKAVGIGSIEDEKRGENIEIVAADIISEYVDRQNIVIDSMLRNKESFDKIDAEYKKLEAIKSGMLTDIPKGQQNELLDQIAQDLYDRMSKVDAKIGERDGIADALREYENSEQKSIKMTANPVASGAGDESEDISDSSSQASDSDDSSSEDADIKGTFARPPVGTRDKRTFVDLAQGLNNPEINKSAAELDKALEESKKGEIKLDRNVDEVINESKSDTISKITKTGEMIAELRKIYEEKTAALKEIDDNLENDKIQIEKENNTQQQEIREEITKAKSEGDNAKEQELQGKLKDLEDQKQESITALEKKAQEEKDKIEEESEDLKKIDEEKRKELLSKSDKSSDEGEDDEEEDDEEELAQRFDPDYSEIEDEENKNEDEKERDELEINLTNELKARKAKLASEISALESYKKVYENQDSSEARSIVAKYNNRIQSLKEILASVDNMLTQIRSIK